MLRYVRPRLPFECLSTMLRDAASDSAHPRGMHTTGAHDMCSTGHKGTWRCDDGSNLLRGL
eukprot:4039827-Pyramimonas_sp.AAC.1